MPTLISRPLHSESLGHCRDKIEFNLKSQKLEEHNRLLDRRLALRREEQLSDSILKVNKFLDLFSIHSLPAFSRRRLLQAPLFGGACKLLIRFCRSTRISNYLRFSCRLHFRAFASCSPAFWRGAQSRHLLLLVNQNFELSSIFSSPAFGVLSLLACPVWWRDAETSEAVRSDKRILQKICCTSVIFSFSRRISPSRPARKKRASKPPYRPRMPMGTGSAGGCVSR